MLLQIRAPHFTAGIEIIDWNVWKAAPIVKYMLGWEIEKVSDYCKRKGWDMYDTKLERVC